MSRPSSRSRQRAPSSAVPVLNDVVRRSRALSNSIASYGSRPKSRSGSRGRRGDSISSEYERRSISLDRATRFDDMIAQAGGVPRPTKIRRWDGNCRTTTNWDCLHKDPELWFSNGDCLVHFYGEHESRRGPSLRLWLADIQSSNCRPLLQRLLCRPHQESYSDSELSDFSGSSGPQPSYDLYIPAPKGLRFEDATNYHLTTRNFFAWMFEKPLVGIQLGRALCDLLDRMNDWRYDPEENEDDFLAYIDVQGYTDFRDCPDHALAVLYWAELNQHSDLWIDSFVHCTGMNEQLVSSDELNNISLTTKALITRANLDMAVRLDRASAALADFCETDSTVNRRLNLSDPSLRHLERFRTWLQGFYVQRHGYWPPHVIKTKYGKVRPLPKHTLLTMYSDFRNLYQYIVNSEADPFLQPEISRSVVDVLTTYDEQMKFVPLPHLLPHLPTIDFDHADLRRTKSSFSIFKSKKTKLNSKRVDVASALTFATNSADIKVISSSIVREYAIFERSFTIEENERITATEARMARWVLIYALLQILISVTNAPDEVRDVEGVDYSLCAQTAGCPPWKMQNLASKKQLKRRSRSMVSMQRAQPDGNEIPIGFEQRRSTSVSGSRHRTVLGESSAGPPPLNPPPPPQPSRTPSRADHAQARRQASQSRLPVPIKSLRSPNVTPKPSRIPLPVARRIPDLSQSDIDDYGTANFPDEDNTEQIRAPTLPTKSSQRSTAAASSPPSILPPIQISPLSSNLALFVSDDSLTPPPVSAKSAKRLSKYLENHGQIMPDLETEQSPQVSPLLGNSPSSTPLESPLSRREDYFDLPNTSATHFSMPRQSPSVESRTQTSAIQTTPRGRATTRSSEHQPNHESSISSRSRASSGTEHRTVGSPMTTPSVYAPKGSGEYPTNRPWQSSASSPTARSFAVEDIPPLPTSSITHPNLHYTLSNGLHFSLPAGPGGFVEEQSKEIIRAEEPSLDNTTQPLKSWNEQNESQGRPSFGASEPTAASSSIKDFAAYFSIHRASTDGQEESAPACPPPTIGQSHQHSGSLHVLGKNRRHRLFGGEETSKQGSLAARRQSKGLVALVSKSIVSKRSISPALPTTPLTPMSFTSFESTGQSSRTGSRAGTSFSSSRPSNIRRRSSELAQQFREEIVWKKGAGWDESVECLLMGEDDSAVR